MPKQLKWIENFGPFGKTRVNTNLTCRLLHLLHVVACCMLHASFCNCSNDSIYSFDIGWLPLPISPLVLLPGWEFSLCPLDCHLPASLSHFVSCSISGFFCVFIVVCWNCANMLPLFLPASADSSIIVLARHAYSQSKPNLSKKTNQAKTSWPNVLSWSATELTVNGNIRQRDSVRLKSLRCTLILCCTSKGKP